MSINNCPQDFGGIKGLEFSEARGPVFRSDVSTAEHLSEQPMLRDPYESSMVTVRCALFPSLPLSRVTR
jgi:hypothetical protein